MRRVCGGAVLVIVVLTVIGAGAPAEAGGSTFDFNRRWFAPGQLAVGRTRFSDWVGAQGRVAQGPYFAYLVRGNGWIEPPRLPRKAIRLGQVKMLRVEGTIWKASVRFVVPHVRPGSYMVSICNDPCRNAFVGDLVGAWIFVASSAEQARMKNLEARIEERISQQVADTTSDLQRQLESLREAVETPMTAVRTELRLSAIEDQVKGLNAQARQLARRGDQEAPPGSGSRAGSSP